MHQLHAKKEIIEELNKLNIEKIDSQIIPSLLDKLLSGFKNLSILFNPGLVVYRGIKYDEKPHSWKNIIYPPTEKAKINRASNEGEQMFYCTTSKKAVFYELNVGIGSKLVITNWSLNSITNVVGIPYMEKILKQLGAQSTNEFLGSGTEYIDLSSGYNKDDKMNLMIAEYLADSFCKSIEGNLFLYKLTNAIAKKLIYGERTIPNSCEGIFYPTIRYDANADNIAFLPTVIDRRKLNFDRAEFVEVKELHDDKYRYTILDFADTIKEDLIEWKNLSHAWTIDDEMKDIFFVENENEVEAYDSNGIKICHDKI
jgi:hypothetical protein